MTALLNPKLAWYVSRAAGLVAWLLCAASILWGLFLSSKLVRRRGLPAWLLDLHRYLGSLAVVTCAVHLGGLVADSYTHFGWGELFVPFASSWRPGAVAWGIVAMDVLLAVELTSLVRKRLPKRVWHAVHLTSIPMFAAASVHGITAGTDWSNRVVQVGAAVVTAAIVVQIALRLIGRRRSRQRRSTVTQALAPRPMTCASATAAPST